MESYMQERAGPAKSPPMMQAGIKINTLEERIARATPIPKGRNPISIGVEAPETLTFLENNEALAAEGLYYATWVDGNSVPYENSDGDTIELYDAQLYFLAGEAPDKDAAQEDCLTWLAAAKENYDVHSEMEHTMLRYVPEVQRTVET